MGGGGKTITFSSLKIKKSGFLGEEQVARINISRSISNFESCAGWCKEQNFIELSSSWFFDLKTQDGENFVVDNDPEKGCIFLGFTKEEAEEKVKQIKEEFELYKKLQKKYGKNVR